MTDDRREQPCPADDPLGGPDQLGVTARIDAELPGAVLARHLADPRVDPESAQGSRVAVCPGGESRVDGQHRVRLRNDLVDDQAPLVIGGRPAARGPDHRGEPSLPRRSHRAREVRQKAVATAEGHRRQRPIDAENRVAPARRDSFKQRGRQGEIQRWVVAGAAVDKVDRRGRHRYSLAAGATSPAAPTGREDP
jgi:hypothetical protein